MSDPQRRVVSVRGLRRFYVRVVLVVTVVTAATVAVSAAAIWYAEHDASRANIRSYWTAVWWAMETITTVGYGDHNPTTTLGRVVAGLLMVVGVALVGVITATVVTWFFSELDVLREVRQIEAAEEKTEATLDAVVARLREVSDRLAEVERHVRDR